MDFLTKKTQDKSYKITQIKYINDITDTKRFNT